MKIVYRLDENGSEIISVIATKVMNRDGLTIFLSQNRRTAPGKEREEIRKCQKISFRM